MDQIGRITPGGAVTEFSGLTAAGSVLFIAAGPDVNLWFTEIIGGRIGKITPAGHVTELALPDPTSQPEGIVAGPDGNLWFIESFASKIAHVAL